VIYLKIRIPLIFILIILLGGCFVNSENYDQETIDRAKETVENYINNNYKDIKSIEIKDVYENPMGELTVDGTVNESSKFNIGLESDFTIGSIGRGKGFPDKKDECKDKVCDY